MLEKIKAGQRKENDNQLLKMCYDKIGIPFGNQ
jgi:hypothetical protein